MANMVMRRSPAGMAVGIASAITLSALALTSAPALAGADTQPKSDQFSPQDSKPVAKAVNDSVIASLSQRLFPLFDALGRNPGQVQSLISNPDLAPLIHARAKRQAACASDANCIANAMIWTNAEIKALSEKTPGIGADDGPAAQATRELQGVNEILRTFGLGYVPPYPMIDGSGTLNPLEARSRLQSAALLSQVARSNSVQNLDPSFDFALALLDANNRMDAIEHEPLTGGLNATPMKRAKSIDWKRYRYSAMLVTGVGPEVESMPLSPFGKYHLRLAAARYAAGDVPFIIVSGGRAHPHSTPYVEAIEMRQALITRYNIPADAIVIEPYARHTTTNLRNGSRLLMAMGAPLDKSGIIISNANQSAMIEHPDFIARNNRELGYMPGTIGRRITASEIEFLPSKLSARVDPRDPLDP